MRRFVISLSAATFAIGAPAGAQSQAALALDTDSGDIIMTASVAKQPGVV